jgi:hypothetical protein
MRDLPEDILEVMFLKELDESEESKAPEKTLTNGA